MKKLLCIDGNSILNRQFYGIRPLSTPDGFPTNALFGLVNVLSKQLESVKPDFAAVAFDLKAPTFRHQMYSDYKAGRKPMPEELARQLPVAKEFCRAMGLAVLELEGYEADDILGTLSSMAESEGECEAFVLTGDRDSLQLISDKTTVLLATNTDTITMDGVAFFEKYGVSASQFVDVKALMGDSSDNIPGVPGVGEKTAFKLIAEEGSLDKIYENLDEIKLTPSVRSKMENGRESAFMSRALATIKRDVPLGIALEDIAHNGFLRGELRALLLRYNLMSALKRLGLDKEEAAEDVSSSGQAVTSENEKPEAISLCANGFSSLAGEYYAISLTDEKAIISDGEKIYEAEFCSALEELLKAKKIIAYDCKSLYKSLESKGIFFRDCYFDVMLAAYVDDSSRSGYPMESLVGSYLGDAHDEGIPDAFYAAKMWKKMEERLSESGQIKLLYDVEMPLAAVLCDMENEGFKIDREGIAKYGEELEDEARALEFRIFMAAGGEFNINSPKQLGEVLFEQLMLPMGKKTKTGYSTNADVLEKLRRYHPIIDDILEYRQVTKLKSTYVEGLLKATDEDGICHTTFKQTGTATGRLSSVNPNLQNIPIRTEAGRRFREFFIPRNEGRVLIDADYSQIELRVLAHVSGDEHMIDAFLKNEDIHTATSCRVFGVEPHEVSVEMRKRAKAVNFGILYGMGEFSLAEDLKISRAQAKEYIESYLSSYPAIDKYLHDVAKDARADGYVTTMLGRRRYIPELAASNKNMQAFGERVARNSPIQGSSADIIKIAMINVAAKLRESGLDARLILQVHDELLIECSAECATAALELLKSEMESAVKLSVPLKVEANIGENWLVCH